MNTFNHLRFRDAQEVIETLERLGMIRVSVATKIFFRQSKSLDHGAHGTIKNEDPALEKAF